MTGNYDIAIIGAGMAGASLASFAAPHARILLIEGEALPGYHTTGRSAAFYAETYGGPHIQPLTTASRGFFDAPPDGFHDGPLLLPRGALHVARAAGMAALDRFAADFADSSVALERLSPAMALAMVPELAPTAVVAAIHEPSCMDIDVAALHQAFLRHARRHGLTQVNDARVRRLERDGTGWRIETSAGVFRAAIVVNAAGAWADDVAALADVPPIGLQPMRRTVVAIDVEPAPLGHLPLVIDAEGRFYFKPDAGRLWLSPHDETPSPPCDAQPEELDVAAVIDLFSAETHWRVRRIERAWAGLRSFAPDRVPVYGFDPAAPGFFWCAGQGGFGIQTAPAAGRMAASLLTGADKAWLTVSGLDPASYHIDRLRAGQTS